VPDSRRRDGTAPSDAPPRSDTNAPTMPAPGSHGDVLRVPAQGTTSADQRSDAPTARVRGDSDEAPSLRPAVLGRLEGVGLLTVVHDADGKLVDADGSWRPGDETVSMPELEATFPAGLITTFAGTMLEARGAGPARDVSLQVVVTRVGEYEDYEGRPLRIVNFIARDVA
jgi:hypothetical protein